MSIKKMLGPSPMDKMSQVVVFGFGAQGRAQALNLKDGGWKVAVYLRPTSRHLAEAKEAGLPVLTDPAEAAKKADIAVLLLPDAEQPNFYKNHLEPNLRKRTSLIFAHGFNIHFKQIVPRPDLDILLAAPFLQGDALRQHYIEKIPVNILVAIEQDGSDRGYRIAETYSKAIGGPATHLIFSTFREETETDLFAEQTILVGGLLELLKAGADTLTEAGYSKEVVEACGKELPPITALIDRWGPKAFLERISDTARFGAATRGPRIIDTRVKQTLKTILEEIRSGRFTEELLTAKKPSL